MSPAHGRRLTELIPAATYSELGDAYTLLPLDRPDDIAAGITNFAAGVELRRSDSP